MIYFTLLPFHRVLNYNYPQPLKKGQFLYQIISQLSLDQQKEGGEFHLLTRVAFEWDRLKAGERILTQLIQFYSALHSQLEYSLTYEEVQSLTISDAICKHQNLQDLYDTIKGEYFTPCGIFYGDIIDLIVLIILFHVFFFFFFFSPITITCSDGYNSYIEISERNKTQKIPPLSDSSLLVVLLSGKLLLLLAMLAISRLFSRSFKESRMQRLPLCCDIRHFHPSQ